MAQASGRSATRIDVYQSVMAVIIAQIEAGAGSYQMPWHHNGSPMSRPRNAVVQTYYRGVNVLALWAAAKQANYDSGLWATYRQWQLVKAQVRKGEQGTLVVFWKQLDDPAEVLLEDDPDEPRVSKRIIARGFWVFNLSQVDGYSPSSVPELSEVERISRAEQFHANLGIETRFGGDEAFYSPNGDYIQLPAFERFRDAGAFYTTLFHEGAHATGAAHRLDRNLTARFGSETYAFEELIAEWASAMTCMSLTLAPEPRREHARYIASWLRVIRQNPRALFSAASAAQAVADWMWLKQPQQAEK